MACLFYLYDLLTFYGHMCDYIKKKSRRISGGSFHLFLREGLAMMPKSVSARAQSPEAVELRRKMDEQRKILGGSRREGLAKLDIPGKGKEFTQASMEATKRLRKGKS